MTDPHTAPELASVPGTLPLAGFDDGADGEADLIPREWERPFQMPMPGMAPEDLAKDDRRAYCEHLLGNISALYRALREQAHVARVRLWSDGQQGLPATMAMPACDDADEARQQAIEAIGNWYYRDGQDQKETVAYIGAVSASPHTLNALCELNALKHEFSALLGRLRDALEPNSHTRGDIHNLVALLSESASKNATRKASGALVRQLLNSRLNIRQLVRTIPVVDEFPHSIRWRWIDSPSTVKVDRQKILDLLERKEANPEALMDFQKVASVSDPVFCLRKGVSSDLRISIKLSAMAYRLSRLSQTGGTQDSDTEMGDRYVDFKSRLPVFYAAAPSGFPQTEPRFSHAPDNAPVQKRKSRVEEQPFLMTLPVHRYKTRD